MSSWDFEHLALLLRISETFRTLKEFSASKQKCIVRLVQHGFIKYETAADGTEYLEVTPKGSEVFNSTLAHFRSLMP
jgi:hypothetical protein